MTARQPKRDILSIGPLWYFLLNGWNKQSKHFWRYFRIQVDIEAENMVTKTAKFTNCSKMFFEKSLLLVRKVCLEKYVNAVSLCEITCCLIAWFHAVSYIVFFYFWRFRHPLVGFRGFDGIIINNIIKFIMKYIPYRHIYF